MKQLINIICGVGLLLIHPFSYGDGLDNWHLLYSAPEGIYYSSIASGPDRFVAVSESGRIATSTDAVQWMVANSGTKRDLFRVASGNGMFVATGFPDTVIRSSDGTNWQSAGSQELDTVVGGVAFANGQFFLL